ncbi:MAG: hypothetical protein ACYSWX_01985 [Planctomycetota bacterium]
MSGGVERARTSRAAGGLLAGLVATLAGGCGRGATEAETLFVTRFKQAGLTEAFLNERLVVHFDRLLDPSSIHRQSARVVDLDGELVQGRWVVERERLHFEPRLPRDRDLEDGSLRPGRTYRIELRGFPLPDGVRAMDGAPLEGAWSAEFSTAAVDPLFDDPTLGRSAPLVLESPFVGPGGPVRLRCQEPVDPRSIAAAEFSLRRLVVDRAEAGSGVQARTVNLAAELVSNGDDGAVIELWPILSRRDPSVRGLVAPGDVHLWIDPEGAQPLDLGGNRVPLAWRLEVDSTGDLEVVRDADDEQPQSRLFEFLDPDDRSPEEPSGCDGTAHWAEDGAVTIRMPSSVGDGSDGAVVLTAEQEAQREVQSTILVVPTSAEVTLPEDGLVLLRAQKQLRIDGRMLRRTLPADRSWRADETPQQWRARFERERDREASDSTPLDFGEDEALEEWLDRAEASGVPWTVLIAGGDIVVEGELRLDGPLVMIAGGRIRARGGVSATAIWRTEPGGMTSAFPASQVLPLKIDDPLSNPLIEPIRVRVLSTPFRPAEDGAIRWSGARVVADAGDGEVRVRYLGERRDEDGVWRTLGPVEDPTLLTNSPTIRLSLELGLGPTDRSRGWRPPRIDAVELFWESRDGRP